MTDLTPEEALAALRQAWFEEVAPGPWHPVVDATDAATLVNVLDPASGYAIVRSDDLAGLLDVADRMAGWTPAVSDAAMEGIARAARSALEGVSR